MVKLSKKKKKSFIFTKPSVPPLCTVLPILESVISYMFCVYFLCLFCFHGTFPTFPTVPQEILDLVPSSRPYWGGRFQLNQLLQYVSMMQQVPFWAKMAVVRGKSGNMKLSGCHNFNALVDVILYSF